MVEVLRRVPLFGDCSEEQLEWLWGQSTEVELSAGELLYREGSPADSFYVVLDGELQIAKQVDGQGMVLGERRPGDFIGEVPLLLGTPNLVTARALAESRVLRLGQAAFRQMLSMCPSIAATILNVMARRVQDVEGLVRERQKMAALGKLSAGLAHELNNPASAAHRAMAGMRKDMLAWQALALDLGRPSHDPDQIERLLDIQRDALERASQAQPLDPLSASDREDEITDWLEEHDVAESWKLAPTLVQAGLDVEWLDGVAERAGGTAPADLLAWLEAGLSVAGMLDEAEHSTARILDLVRAIKEYTYMDQAPLQEMDLHEGLENTLTILGHRLKSGVTVLREYDSSLPRICAYGSQLNQVWTNLLDNAVDAMEGQGIIRIRTARENEHVLVEIADNGPGIPPEVRARIFEPFFTTKDVGQGSGLGLDIVYGIVVDKHHGDIRVLSEPGDTRFEIRLPLRPPEQASGESPMTREERLAMRGAHAMADPPADAAPSDAG